MPAARSVPRRPPYRASICALIAMGMGAFALHQTLQTTLSTGALAVWAIALACVWSLGALALRFLSSPSPHAATWDERLGDALQARRHPFLFAVAAGVAVAVASLVGALVLRTIPGLGGGISFATSLVANGPVLVFLVALITGMTEELFFRIGLLRLLPPRSALVTSTVLYGLVTLASGNPPLVLAAVVLGAVCAFALRSTGRWYAPIIVHAMWTVALVGFLPHI